MTKFIYNNKQYETWNLKKELKRMGIKKEDIILINDTPLILISEPDISIKLYTFINKKTGYRITTVYNNLDNYTNINKDEWEIIK